MADFDNVVEQIEDVEEFRVFGGFPNYSVSNLGRVRNDRTQRILRPKIDRWGYYQVCLQNGGKQSTKRIHKLEMTAFVGDSEGRQVNHKDRNSLNNHLSNLEYCSSSENQQNRSSYNGKVVEYVETLSPDAIPYPEHNGFALKSGYWRDGDEYYREVSNGYRKITKTPHRRKFHISLTFEDGRGCSIYVDA
jgi:hypothetical protein